MALCLMAHALLCLLTIASIPVDAADESSAKSSGLNVFTVATERTDGYHRFMRSANKYGLDVTVLGMGEKWKGGDVTKYAGGGQKVVLLEEAIKKYKDQADSIVMFVDSYDLVFTGSSEDILKAFKKFDSKVVFSAEDFCWPDKSLAESYPLVKMTEKRYLNSGGFIGYGPEVYKILSSAPIKNQDDDQLFYTKIFLDEKLRNELSIKLDSRGEIFQNLNGALDEVKLKFKGSSSYLYNVRTGNSPLVVHGNGPIKTEFNALANYLADQWTPVAGCQSCTEGTISLEGVKKEDLPHVFLGIFIEQPTPFVDQFFDNIVALDYPHDKIDIFIHYANDFHEKHVQSFLEKHQNDYNTVKVMKPCDDLCEVEARNKAIEECIQADCQYYFSLDAVAQLENPKTLQLLIEKNRSVIAPMMMRPGRMWSNFWGAMSEQGFYKRADDYVDITQGKRSGIWNVPYISIAYLIHAHRLPQLLGSYSDSDQNVDAEMSLAKRLREMGIFMYVDNLHYYGHLVDNENYETSHLHNDLYSIIDNKYTWERKYIHEGYQKRLEPEFEIEQPCPDVFWFPLVNAKFCQHLIEEMEHFGQWSGGKAQDPRLQGGYENVPTIDIHTNQIGWERHWLYLLKEYVVPVNSKVFMGYFSEARAIMNFVVRYQPHNQNRLRPHADSSTFTVNIALNEPGIEYEIRANMNFVVRYQPNNQDRLRAHSDSSTYTVNLALNTPGIDYEGLAIMNFVVRYNYLEQRELRPHHDSSTYSINIALNQPGIDFEGGGTNFLRQNCRVTKSRRGWMLMHPGRLTHFHEGLPITNGTRYIMGGGTNFLRYNCSVTKSRRGWAVMFPGRLTHFHEGLPVTNGTRYIMVSFVDP